jgi:2-polyprenyl-3-methyl-5-hydroxy-6-metoxy-1,4-benzoquinol methylase
MRVGIIPENPLERIVLALGVVPEPLVTTQLAFTMARAIQAGVDLGLYDALEAGPLSLEEIAAKCRLDVKATRAILGAIVGCDYLAFAGGRYSLRPVARKWLLRSAESSLSNKMVFQKIEWDWLGHLEEFARTGKPLDAHGEGTTAETWRSYQLAMTDIGRLALPEAVRRTPIPKGATAMLDVGGSGGTYSAAFVRARPGLRSTILDLPSAVVHAKPIVDGLGLGDRLSIEAGNVLETDLGRDRYDFVFMASVAHHFSDEENQAVAKKYAAALKPGGVYCIQDVERAPKPSPKNQAGGLFDLYFALTSRSGTWSVDEMNGWLRAAGLAPGKPVRFRTAPGLVQAWGRKG